MTQIEGQVDVMVVECIVLLRIQNLQQGCGRIPLEALPQLVDLIQQNQRVIDAGLLDGRHNAARHGTDIGLSVAHNIGFIADAAQRNTHIFADVYKRQTSRCSSLGFSEFCSPK